MLVSVNYCHPLSPLLHACKIMTIKENAIS